MASNYGKYYIGTTFTYVHPCDKFIIVASIALVLFYLLCRW
jgi:hypothetical protein